MAITISRRHILVIGPAWTVFILVLIAPPRAGATDWIFAPALRLRESYTDNVLLAPPAQAKSDFITEIAPSFALIGKGPRLRVDLQYTLQKLIYTRQPSVLNHHLTAASNAELLEDWLFLDAHAGISQHSVSAFGAQPVDNLPRGDNRSTVRTISISPYLRHHFRGIATTELRYSHAAVSSGSDLLSVRSDALFFAAAGDSSGRSWNWDARFDKKRTEDAQLAPVNMEKATFSLRYPLGSKFNLFGSAGYEDEGYASNQSSGSQGRFWSVGAGWYPSGRSSIVVSGGKRFFGNTYTLDAAYRSHHSSWSLSYSEDITTTPAQFVRLNPSETASLLNQLWSGVIPDPLLRQQRIITFLRYSQALGAEAGAVNYFSHRYFLQKQAKLAMVRASPKSTFMLGVNATDRTAQTDSGITSILLPDTEFALEDRTRQSGANAGWSWRMSPRNNLNASAGYGTIKSLSAGRKDSNLVVSAGISRVLQPRMTAAIDLRHIRHNSNRGGNYRENGISATLTIQL